jgi:hypothetical protein
VLRLESVFSFGFMELRTFLNAVLLRLGNHASCGAPRSWLPDRTAKATTRKDSPVATHASGIRLAVRECRIMLPPGLH